ncbi:hypothetical protein D3C71_1937370 [compost metagenome]
MDGAEEQGADHQQQCPEVLSFLYCAGALFFISDAGCQPSERPGRQVSQKKHKDNEPECVPETGSLREKHLGPGGQVACVLQAVAYQLPVQRLQP